MTIVNNGSIQVLKDELTRLLDSWTATMNEEQAKCRVDSVGIAAGIRGFIHGLRVVLRALSVQYHDDGPGSEALECLMDVVSHHSNIVAGFAAQRLAAEDAEDCDTVAYWNHEINVADRMKSQAERALASIAQPGATTGSQPAAWFVEGLTSTNERAPSVWIRREHAEAAASALYKASIEPLVRRAARSDRIGKLPADLIQRCRELVELSETANSPQVALRALAATYSLEISAHDRRNMAVSQTHTEAMRALIEANSSVK
ncbi:hypothetical protein QZM64_40005 [Burkholderia cepacia]|uniref:hypothetical protein n=1 Tax=Burkholderia cepacia complex TaxID=87882 RepID=UPI000CFF982E|nr:MULTISPECIES: hypothetical protein [Burkholderia cepacia complex]MDN7445356.1 hypothetical protein [Burkholderia cepacia]PRD92229.1 hypothetical protein C6P88_16350 [Burkholderia contaminans]